MRLEQLTQRIFYYTHEQASDRPCLAYVRGDRYSLAVDAGYSERHLRLFYAALREKGLPLPDFTLLTHWHFAHSLALHAAAGVTVSCEKTAEYLAAAQRSFCSPGYAERLRRQDAFFAKEYADTEARVALPALRFGRSLQFSLGGVTAEAFLVPSPHTDDSVCVCIPQEQALFLGDAVCEDVYNGGYLDKEKLRGLVKIIEEMPCRHCVLSHEPPLEKEELLQDLYKELGG